MVMDNGQQISRRNYFSVFSFLEGEGEDLEKRQP
jgi:hypothetical protein